MKKIFLLIFILFIAACTPQTIDDKECVKDTDCMKGGCSSQVCSTKEKAASIITTCEYREEYACYQEANCGCVEGVCGWKEQAEVDACVAEKQGSGFEIVE